MATKKAAAKKSAAKKSTKKTAARKKVRVKVPATAVWAVYFNKNLKPLQTEDLTDVRGRVITKAWFPKPPGVPECPDGFHEVTIMGRSFCWPN